MKQKNRIGFIVNRDSQERDITCRAMSTSIRSTTANDEDLSWEAVIATEEPAIVYDWDEGYVREILLMDGVQYAESVPFLDSHSRWSIDDMIGSTRKLRVEGDKLIARNFAHDDDKGRRVFSMVKAGHLTDNSVGYRVLAYTTIKAGETAIVAGRSFTASESMALRITTSWQIIENSACPIGADPNAKNRGDSSGKGKRSKVKSNETGMGPGNDNVSGRARKGSKMELTQQERAALRSAGLTDEQIDQMEVAVAKRMAQREMERSDNGGNKPDELEALRIQREAEKSALAAERKRVEDIKLICDGHIDTAVRDAWISEGKSESECRSLALATLKEQKRAANGNFAPNINIGAGGNVDMKRCLALATTMQYNSSDISEKTAKRYSQAELDAAESMSGITFGELAARSLAAFGHADKVTYNTMETIRAAISTNSLPKILGEVANLSAAQAYAAVEVVYEELCARKNVKNFKTQTTAKMSAANKIGKVNDKGELPHTSFDEEYEAWKIDTFGQQAGISRQDMINDDLGQFVDTLTEIIQDMRAYIDDTFIAMVVANGNCSDGKPFFHADHNNLVTGAALGPAGLTEAFKAWRKQKKKNGVKVKVSPNYLLVPAALENTAEGLTESDQIIITGSTDTITTNKNLFKGKLTTLASGSLDESSEDNWYMFAKASRLAAFVAGFLNGKDTPNVTPLTMDANALVLNWNIYSDFGFGYGNYRGASKCTL